MNLRTLQDFLKMLSIFMAIQKTFKNHRTIFWSLQGIPELVKLQESSFGPKWQSSRLLSIIEKYLKACKTLQDMSNFMKNILSLLAIQILLRIIEKYLEACKTFQDLSNFKKNILSLLAIQETFKNHRKIFWSLQDIPGLIKLQKCYLGHSGNPGDF